MSGAFPPKPHSSGMTYWSRYDAVCQPRGNTDNWAKMKLKVNSFPTKDSDVMSSWVSPSASYQGRRFVDQSFDDAVQTGLRGNMPGNYSLTQSTTALPPISLRNSFQDRAKEGFKYWLIEKPKPTSYGRYGIGSFKTVLGVGNAPRT